MRKIVRAFEPFECPYCGQRYEVHEDGGEVVLLHESGSPCSHIDLEVLPVGGGVHEVYFVDVDEDDEEECGEEDDEDGEEGEGFVVVRAGEPFECPVCRRRYRIEEGRVHGEPCTHIWGPLPLQGELFAVWFEG